MSKTRIWEAQSAKKPIFMLMSRARRDNVYAKGVERGPKMSTLISCLVLPCKPGAMPLTPRNSSLCFEKVLPRGSGLTKTLAFSSSISSISLSIGGASFRTLENPKSLRRSVVCNGTPKKRADSAEKRARQAEKRRIYNKGKKSEVKTRMRKVFEELDVLKKKVDAKAEEILFVEKLISEAYSAIDKAVKSGTLHKNTGAHRKSRLARRKKTVEMHHAWYIPTSTLNA